MMRKRIAQAILIVLVFGCMPIKADAEDPYEVYIKRYERPCILVEFAQVRGMKDERKQKDINYLLEKQIFDYLTDMFNSYWLGDGTQVENILRTLTDLEDTGMEFKCYTGLTDDNLLSVWYSVYAYSYGAAHPNTWGLGFTIDLNSRRWLELDEIVELNESFMDLEGVHIFDRAYGAEPYAEGKYPFLDMGGSWSSKEEILERLQNNSTKKWYLTAEKGLSLFVSVQNTDVEFEIPLENLDGHMKLEYLK